MERDGRYGFTLQTVTDPAELELASQLSRRLDLVEPLIVKWNRVSRARSGKNCELTADDRHSAWRHLSHTVSGALNLSADNLRAFRDLIRPEGKLLIPQLAHYSLLRSALEGGSLALWILHPDDPADRIGRLLRAAAAELDDDNALSKQVIDALARDPDRPMSNAAIDKARKQHRQRNQEHSRQIRRVASAFGLADPTSTRWKVGYAEIVRDATAATGVKPHFGETTWRMISGLCHPSLTRATARSNVEEILDNGDGTLNAVLTSDLGLTRTAFEAAWLNMSTAVDYLAVRKLRPADAARYPLPTS